MSCGGNQFEFPIGGLVVKFPFNPYPPQKAMMAKIIRALGNRENALLESPTGSGKSLALLCSALAWQKNEFSKIKLEDSNPQKVPTTECCCKCHVQSSSREEVRSPRAGGGAMEGVSSGAAGMDTGTSLAGGVSAAGGGVASSSSTTLHCPVKPTTPATPILIPDSCPPVDGNPGNVVDLTTTSAEAQLDVTHPPLQTVSVTTSTSEVSASSSPGKKKEEDGKSAGMAATPLASGPLCGGSRVGVVEGVVNNEKKKLGDDDDDFKVSKKRLRKVPASDRPMKRKKPKGVVYEDVKEEDEHPELTPDSHGHAQWKVEVPGAAAGLGVPRSQIMDTGPCVKTDDHFPKQGQRSPASACFPLPPPPTHCLDCNCSNSSSASASTSTSASASAKKLKSPETNLELRKRHTKIYFATRTHKQITQITHELKRTAYRDTPMSILASREHTCIHPMVSKSKEKNDECKKLLDYDNGVSCSFFYKVQAKLGSQAQLRQLGLDTAWDIEDLVTVGSRVRACPYFALRGLIEEAEIIFCPYNYLINPLIRDQMLIDLTDKVVIVDEAHNIEDSAREAASLSVTNYQLEEVSSELQDVIKLSPYLAASYANLLALIAAILRWIKTTSETLPAKGYEQAFGVWSGHDFLPILDREFKINAVTLQMYEKHLEAATEAAMDKNGDRFDEDDQRCPPEPTLTLAAIGRIKAILLVMRYLFLRDKVYLGDYRMSLIKSTAMMPKTNNWIRRNRKKSFERTYMYTLNFWCFNPSVAFSDLSVCRSIILTSGTLSPMRSFASELGVPFPIQLEANHVVQDSRTMVRSLSCGPNGVTLSATYQNSETYEFKDELGALVLGVCETVPYGILCFMSSYNMLEKLASRWQETDVWGRILAYKEIVCEPRTGGKEVFDEVMSTYYKTISTCEQADASGVLGKGMSRCTGALFFAVYRGKVSEGLDFTDNNARAVITIGIPFPSIKNKQIELKREYNNEHAQKRHLLSGKEWYEIQAYRALNQALGRCIRHKQDWGALLLVDDRYKVPHYSKGLSRWVRQRIQHECDFNSCMVSLKEFVDRMSPGDSPKSSRSAAEPPAAPMSSSTSSHHPTSSAIPSYFALSSPSAAIPDHFHLTSPSLPSSTSTHLPSSTSTPTRTPLKSKVLQPSPFFPGRNDNLQVPSSASPSRPTLASTSSPAVAYGASGSTREYPPIIPIQSILSGENITTAVRNAEKFLVAPEQAGSSSSGHHSVAEMESETTLVYYEATPDNQKQVTYSRSPQDRAAGVLAARVIDMSERKGNTVQEETGNSSAATIPDTPPGSPEMVGSPLMFDMQSKVSEMDAQNSFLKELLEENELIEELAVAVEAPLSKGCCSGAVDGTIPLSEVAKLKGLDSSGEAAETKHPLPSTEACDGRLNLVTRRKRNTRQAASRRTTRSTAKAATVEEGSEHGVAVRCPCGSSLAVLESVQRENLKKIFTQCGVIQITGSILWRHLHTGSDQSSGKLEVAILSADNMKFHLKKGSDDNYNSVWDEELAICYSLIECGGKCGRSVGVLVHSTNHSGPLDLSGKVVFPACCVTP